MICTEELTLCSLLVYGLKPLKPLKSVLKVNSRYQVETLVATTPPCISKHEDGLEDRILQRRPCQQHETQLSQLLHHAHIFDAPAFDNSSAMLQGVLHST